MARRIRIPQRHEDLVRSLAGGGPEGSNDSVFESMADVLAFAAYLGFSRSNRAPIGEASKKIDPIRAEYIPSYAIDILALLQTKGMDIFGEEGEDERYNIFEEHACGGLQMLNDALQGKNLTSMRVMSILNLIGANGPDNTVSPVSGSDCQH